MVEPDLWGEPPPALPANEFCPACQASYRARGQIGICDHEFEGRPLRYWWAIMNPDPAPAAHLLTVGVTLASTYAGATEILKPPQRHLLSVLFDPVVIALAKESGLQAGQSITLYEIAPPKSWRWTAEDRRHY